MLRNKSTFVLKLIAIFIIISSINITISNAGTLDDIISSSDNFIHTGVSEGERTIDQEKLRNASSSIFNVLTIIGIIVILIVGVIIGIQLMTASAEGKAEVKKALIPYIVGSVVILAAFGIWKLCIQIFSQI